MNDSTRQFLKALVDELEDIRANLVVVAHAAKAELSIADSRDAKIAALEASQERFAVLRKKLESL